MPIKYLLDTNAVSAALRGDAPGVPDRLARLRREDVAVSVITAMELEFGLAKRPGTRRRNVVKQFLAFMPVSPLPEDIAATYGALRADLERRGKPIGPLDMTIGAHAVSLGATLVTNNTREFTRIRGLRCEDWTEAP